MTVLSLGQGSDSQQGLWRNESLDSGKTIKADKGIKVLEVMGGLSQCCTLTFFDATVCSDRKRYLNGCDRCHVVELIE